MSHVLDNQDKIKKFHQGSKNSRFDQYPVYEDLV